MIFIIEACFDTMMKQRRKLSKLFFWVFSQNIGSFEKIDQKLIGVFTLRSNTSKSV